MNVSTESSVFQSSEYESRLLLVAARNDFETLRLLRAAMAAGRSIGVVTGETLRTLDCRPVPHVSERLHVLAGLAVPDRRLVCFTSGSTGQPKGILRTLESWESTFAVQRRLFPCRQDTQTIVIGSLAHSIHLYAAVEAMDRGVTPVPMPRFVPRLVAEHCRRHDGLQLFATPSHLNLMLSYAERHGPSPLDTVARIFCGGAKFDERRLAAIRALFPAAELVEFFGTTETSYITVKAADAPHGSVGKACPTVRIAIRDGNGRKCPIGEIGTLWVESPMLFERYVVGGDPQTQWDGAFVTVGDQGYLDAEGHFYFTERKGSMVTIAGQNVYLDAIENDLRAILPRGESAVVAVADALRGRCLVAATDIALSEAERARVLRDLRARYGALIAPKALVRVPAWPLLPSGKTDRVEIAARVGGRQ